MKAKLNESMMTNRRCSTTLTAEQKLARAVHAPSLPPAAVAYLRRSGSLIASQQ